ncbi:hypothetical protein [Streptomyces sp. NPDC002172]
MEITPDCEAPLPDPWLVRFADRGHTDVRRIGSGFEGVVHSLGEDRVAKLWSGRPPADVQLTRRVYADIARHPLPFSTLEIFDVEEDVEEIRAVLVTYERKLRGVSLAATPRRWTSRAHCPRGTATRYSPSCAAWPPCPAPKPCAGWPSRATTVRCGGISCARRLSLCR